MGITIIGTNQTLKPLTQVQYQTKADSFSKTSSKALTNRFIDFWLLGGGSLLIWAMVLITEPLRPHSPVINSQYNHVVATFAILSLFCNYPHFLVSYKLAYGQGRNFIKSYWFQLILVPLGLLGLMLSAFMFYIRPDLGQHINHLFLSVSKHTASYFMVFFEKGSGPVIMGGLVNLMLITVGWHYSKQIFGCMMVYSKLDRYQLSAGQRQIIKWSNYGIWFTNYAYLNLNAGIQYYYGVPFLRIGLGKFVFTAALCFFFITLVLFIYKVVWTNYREQGKMFSVNFIIPYIAFISWWIPIFTNRLFMLTIVPFFHSLQYLLFVYKIEKGRLEKNHPKSIAFRGGVSIILLILLGFMFFEFLPFSLDTVVQKNGLLTIWFFIAAFHLFINIHHFFIDNSLWRFKNSNVQKFLFD